VHLKGKIIIIKQLKQNNYSKEIKSPINNFKQYINQQTGLDLLIR
jgi:hypothetical protein